MSFPYRCPSCRTNKSRFNLIRQVPKAVKLNPSTGEIVAEFASQDLDPFHAPYTGPEFKVQCAVCGLIEDERMFIKFGEQHS